MTVLLTTHYMEEADAVCDRVALMHRGRIQALGSPRTLRRALGRDATLEDVFRHHTGDDFTEGEASCVTSVAPVAPPAVSADGLRRPGPDLAHLVRRAGSLTFCIVEVREAPPRPLRARHPRHPARAVAGRLRQDVQQPARHPVGRRAVPRLPRARRPRPVDAVRLGLLRHPGHLGARRRRPQQAHGHADAPLGARHRQGLRGGDAGAVAGRSSSSCCRSCSAWRSCWRRGGCVGAGRRGRAGRGVLRLACR